MSWGRFLSWVCFLCGGITLNEVFHSLMAALTVSYLSTSSLSTATGHDSLSCNYSLTCHLSPSSTRLCCSSPPISLNRYITQIHVYRSRATLSVSSSLIQQWILADHIPPSLDLDPNLPRSFTTSHPRPHLPHIQTTHPSATSLSRRLPWRYGGIRASQTNRSCTGLGFTMHHIDPLHPASCMLLHYMKGKKHILITGLSIT